MVKFKTTAIPSTVLTGVKGKDMYSAATANKALAPVAQVIEAEAKGGWTLHSYVTCPATIYRKKSILEKIPILGSLLFGGNRPEVITPTYYMLIFCKEE